MFTYGEWKLTERKHKGNFWTDGNVLEFDWDGRCIGIHQIVSLRTAFPCVTAITFKMKSQSYSCITPLRSIYYSSHRVLLILP